MCVLSMVVDDWSKTAPYRWPWADPTPVAPMTEYVPAVSRAEFEGLRREIEELKKLMAAAKQYDTATGQPDCESEDKVALLRKLAKIVGVDLADVLG